MWMWQKLTKMVTLFAGFLDLGFLLDLDLRVDFTFLVRHHFFLYGVASASNFFANQYHNYFWAFCRGVQKNIDWLPAFHFWLRLLMWLCRLSLTSIPWLTEPLVSRGGVSDRGNAKVCSRHRPQQALRPQSTPKGSGPSQKTRALNHWRQRLS